MHKTCTGIKKTKKTKTLSIYSGLGVYRLQKFCFFFWFFWCLCRFGEDHALFFLFFLMPVHVWWRLESQNLHRHQKKQKKQTTRCTKPAQASKKPKKTKLWASTQGWGSIDYKSFVFFGFFDACAGLVRFGEDHALFFLFFLMPVQVWWSSYKKSCVSPAFQTLQVQETLQITVFCAYFLSKTTPPWWPALFNYPRFAMPVQIWKLFIFP